MFSYYGGKTKLVNYYPKPMFGNIIEPFAGSARYSLKYYDREITLVDKYSVVIDIWKWLQQCSEKDINSLPNIKAGQKTTEFNLAENERNFLGFLIQHGVATPGITASHWRFSNGSPDVATELKRISKNLFKIKHWQFIKGDYLDIVNKNATWFIDPPYQFGGHKYKHSNSKIDFEKLSDWCRTRMGQIIVCENTKAKWLPFMPIIKHYGTFQSTTEAIWSNMPTAFDAQQQQLF